MRRELNFLQVLSDDAEDRVRVEAEKVPLATSDLNAAMTFAIQDVQALWPAYREKYEREFRREKR